jgi:hypothetical protein
VSSSEFLVAGPLSFFAEVATFQIVPFSVAPVSRAA